MMNHKPIHVVRVGKARAGIFENQCTRNGEPFPLRKVTLEIRFTDKRTGQWRSSKSMTLAELPQAILALQKAHEWMADPSNNTKPKDLYS